MKNQTLFLLFLSAGGLFALIAGCGKKTPENSPSSNPSVQDSAAASGSESAQEASSAEGGAHRGVRWYTNFEEALASAQKENKDLLINFSGSDWCIFCIRLEQDVFSKEAFAKEAEKYFVFVLVDFPNDSSKQSDAVRAQNQELARRYRFRNLFPTLYLAKPDGTPYAMAEYQPLGPAEYLDYLLKIRQHRDR
jgi:thioredoxin-related protein